MKPLQCIVTSYKRPRYLAPCLESMRADGDIELYVVDGANGEGTLDIIREHADGYRLLEGNPGADVLKNEGIKHFVTGPVFVCTSDDFLYPRGWAQQVQEAYARLNEKQLKFVMMASPTEEVIARHTQPEGVGDGVGVHYLRDQCGLDIMTTSISMVAGTIMSTVATAIVGGFPVYGKTGQGDIAISRCFRKHGWEVGYLRHPVIKHLGRFKGTDYPEYTADWNADDAIWQRAAREHNPRQRGPL